MIDLITNTTVDLFQKNKKCLKKLQPLFFKNIIKILYLDQKGKHFLASLMTSSDVS